MISIYLLYMHFLARYYFFPFVIVCVYFRIIVVFSLCTSSTICIIKGIGLQRFVVSPCNQHIITSYTECENYLNILRSMLVFFYIRQYASLACNR